MAQARGEVNSPPPGMLQLDNPEGECHIKYGHLNGSDTFVIKIACGFYENPKMGLSANSGMMLVFNAKTGVPVCILDDKGWLTNARTAAAGALAAGVALAAALKSAGDYRGRKIAVVVCGRNIALDTFRSVLEMGHSVLEEH